jgi:hypothetical protein
MRVLDHCSFFWADYQQLRVVQVCDTHCERCLQELKEDADRRGSTLQLIRTDAATTQVLSRVARSVTDEKPN